MSDLYADRDHFRHMATADHKTECGEWVPGRWRSHFKAPAPSCPGCNPPVDRALFGRLADEIDAYLDADDHQGDLFGGVA